MGASNEQIQAVMRQSVSNDFGISRDTIYATFPNIATGRFAYLLNDERSAVEKIWDIVESEGVSQLFGLLMKVMRVITHLGVG